MSWSGFLPEADHDIRIQVKFHLGKWNEAGQGATHVSIVKQVTALKKRSVIFSKRVWEPRQNPQLGVLSPKIERVWIFTHQLSSVSNCWALMLGRAKQSRDAKGSLQPKWRGCWRLEISQCKVVGGGDMVGEETGYLHWTHFLLTEKL